MVESVAFLFKTMVLDSSKLWFNGGMYKDEAIQLLGGSVTDAANLMGVTYQAISKWPNKLPQRISDRVLGACVRSGLNVPARFLIKNPAAALVVPAPAAINMQAMYVGGDAAPLTR